MFTKIRAWWLLVIGVLVAASEPVLAQTQVDPEIAIDLPFDAAPIIAAVLALAVTVMILVAGPRISLDFGRRALKSIGGIFRG